MLARVKSSAINGIHAVPIEVEVRAKEGQPRFNIIGLGDGAVREARDRVTVAIKQSGFQLPDQILVNLAPAELKKEGAGFDLPIALGILAASGQVRGALLRSASFHGELALDGRIKGIRGVVAYALQALRDGGDSLVVPHENHAEASLFDKLNVVAASSLAQLVAHLRGERMIEHSLPARSAATISTNQLSLDDVWGQESAKRALLIAAAGSHNVLLVGPPGCGKTMLAERFCSLLPPLSHQEICEVAQIHSISGNSITEILHGQRPFRSPHHFISEAGLIGGGNPPSPGEITLAHRGVLFLDEFPEFRRTALEALRGPLEGGVVAIARARNNAIFPARFQLIAAMNPCPCGRLGLMGRDADKGCMCSRTYIQAYLRKLSQPILDRIDLKVSLEGVPLSTVTAKRAETHAENSMPYRHLVQEARARQLRRAGKLNAVLSSAEVRYGALVSGEAMALLTNVGDKMALTTRGVVRLLRVARTIADLGGEEHVKSVHLAEALSFRGLDSIEKYTQGK